MSIMDLRSSSILFCSISVGYHLQLCCPINFPDIVIFNQLSCIIIFGVTTPRMLCHCAMIICKFCWHKGDINTRP